MSGNTLTLSNGLITRQFVTSPAFGTVDFRSDVQSRSILRAVNSEAAVTLDGVQYQVGGLEATTDTHAYLNRSLLTFKADPNAFQYANHSSSPPVAPFHWTPGLRHSPTTSQWPPKGLSLSVAFKPPDSAKPDHAGVVVTVHYEMYVGVPLVAKWVTLDYAFRDGKRPILVDHVTVEYLATQKPYNLLDYSQYPLPVSHSDGGPTGSWLYTQTDQPHGCQCSWQADTRAAVDYGADEQVLVCGYVSGASFTLGNATADGRVLERVDTFRVLELVTDSDHRERVGLSRHRMTRLLAPETQENPIFFHGTDHTPQVWPQPQYKCVHWSC